MSHQEHLGEELDVVIEAYNIKSKNVNLGAIYEAKVLVA